MDQFEGNLDRDRPGLCIWKIPQRAVWFQALRAARVESDNAKSTEEEMRVNMTAKRKRRPTHPGELLREETLPAAGLTPSELAARLAYLKAELMHFLTNVER